ncbi:MAG: T9SS type A sorting domain-containing protein [Flavobacterium sp.]
MKIFRQLLILIVLTCVTKNTFATNGDTLTVNPNPFDSISVIQFTISANDTIWLDIYNTLGQPVKNYFTATVLPSGSYSFNYNGDTLPNGIYFVVLKINSTKTISNKLIKVDNAVSVRESETRKLYSLFYPNPTSSILEIPIDGLKTIIVTDLNGKILLSSLTETKSISLSDFAIGSYIVTVLSEKKQLLATQQIIKIK